MKINNNADSSGYCYESVAIFDSGWTKACFKCGARHGHEPKLSGISRAMDLELCPYCAEIELALSLLPKKRQARIDTISPGM